MMTFREFFEEKHGFKYPGIIGEYDHISQARILDTMADYADYAVDEALRKRLDERAVA